MNISYAFTRNSLKVFLNGEIGPSLLKYSARKSSTSPVTQLSDEEQAMKDMVKRIAEEKIQPLVKQMDEQSMMDKTVIDLLFKNGVIMMR